MTDVTYQDQDFVYVDPEKRAVVGMVEWTKDGLPKMKAFVAAQEPEQEKKPDPKKGDRPRRKNFRKHYPWGTYRSMKRVYRLEGKVKDAESNSTLEAILPKALAEAFWN